MNKTLSLMALLSSSLAWGAMEIPLRGVYAPISGYDDNDTVEVVFEGEMPNACYSLAGDVMRVDHQARTIYLGELVNRNHEGPCVATDAELAPQLQMTVRFERNIDIGRLAAGDYRIDYMAASGMRSRPLNVVTAPTESVDSTSYALISNAFVPTVVQATQPTFEVRLTGSLASSCATLKDVLISLEQDVYVALPLVEFTEDICMPSEQPFYKIVQVPTPAPGRYLLHTRSVGGGAKHSLFSVQ